MALAFAAQKERTGSIPVARAGDSIIDLATVTKTYRSSGVEVQALRGVSLRVQPG